MTPFDYDTAAGLIDRLAKVLGPAGLIVEGIGALGLDSADLPLSIGFTQMMWLVEVRNDKDGVLEVWPAETEGRFLVIERNLLDPVGDSVPGDRVPAVVQVHGITEVAGEEYLAAHLFRQLGDRTERTV